MEEYRLSMEGMNKTFPGVKALDNVQLHVKPGSVHALIGENGAGKSTLMKCLFGIYAPDSGRIAIDGEEVSIHNTLDALQYGISMIHQELNTIPHQTVWENIWVGRFAKKGIVVDEKKMIRKTEALLEEVGLHISPESYARELSVSQQQSMEIAKAVSYDARIIVMDEPTSSLTSSETERLFDLVRKLRAEGRSIIYISHKMEELYEIADEITVMRDGEYVGCWPVSEITIDALIEKMVGRNMAERFPPKENALQEEVLLEVKELCSADPASFQNISFNLHKGEILGIGGLVGAQRTELVEGLFGLHPIASGQIFKNGREIHNSDPSRAIGNGFALLTEERRATGIFPMQSVDDNTLVAAYPKFAPSFLRVIRSKLAAQAARDVQAKMQVRTPSGKTAIRNLSGGNQQKVLVGRWLLMESNILILDEPTRGVDVGAKYEIYKIMLDLVGQGDGIIMVSSEMPELLGMSDRILVMCDGRLTGILRGEEVTQVEILRLATQFEKKSEGGENEGI